MRMICKTCRWYRDSKLLPKGKACFCVDSDYLAERTREDYSCNHWEQKDGEENDKK